MKLIICDKNHEGAGRVSAARILLDFVAAAECKKVRYFNYFCLECLYSGLTSLNQLL